MKRFLGLTVLILGLSVPAHAQSSRAGVAMTGGAAGGVASGGGGAGGSTSGGGESGVTNFHTLPSIPPVILRSSAISGTEADFVPSSFLPYNQAIAAGREVLDAQHRSVAEVAAENSRTHRLKAKKVIVENAAGDAVIATP